MADKAESKEFISESDYSDLREETMVTLGFEGKGTTAGIDTAEISCQTKPKKRSSHGRHQALNFILSGATTPVIIAIGGSGHRHDDSRHSDSKSRSSRERIPAAAGSAPKSTTTSNETPTESFKSPLPPVKTTDKVKTKTLTSVMVVVPPTGPSTVSTQSIPEVTKSTDPGTKQPEITKPDVQTTTKKTNTRVTTEIRASHESTSTAGSSTCPSSASTDEELNIQSGGPHLKRTRKVPVRPGPWNCQLCTANPLQTKGGMRRHYKSHYKIWDPYTDTLVDMSEAERAQQKMVKEMKIQTSRVPSASATGASPVQLDPTRHKSMGPRNEPFSAREIPPRTYTSSSEGSEGSKTATVHGELISSRVPNPEGTSMMSGPTVRIPTKPRRLTTRSRDWQLLVQSPIKLNVPVISGPIFDPPVDTTQEIEPDQEPSDDEVVGVDDEPKTKIKSEFKTYEQVEKNPRLDTLKQLLLIGVEATIETARRQIWPVMTAAQEDQLRTMYETMLATVPLVRQLNRKLE